MSVKLTVSRLNPAKRSNKFNQFIWQLFYWGGLYNYKVRLMAQLFYIFYSLVYNGFSLRAKGVGSPSRERSTEILLSALSRSHWGQLGRLAYRSRPIFYIHQDEGTHCHSQESHPRPPGHRQDHQPQLILLGRKRRSCKIHAHGLRPHAAEPEDD